MGEGTGAGKGVVGGDEGVSEGWVALYMKRGRVVGLSPIAGSLRGAKNIVRKELEETYKRALEEYFERKMKELIKERENLVPPEFEAKKQEIEKKQKTAEELLEYVLKDLDRWVKSRSPKYFGIIAEWSPVEYVEIIKVVGIEDL